MTTCLIVDDEPLAHDLLEEFCGMLPYLKLAGHCYNAMEAMQFLNKQSADIMFLDLNMPKLKGFDFLRTLQRPPTIIVTTAYKEFALEGYELNVADYLLKPFSFERFAIAINKATAKQEITRMPLIPAGISKKFFIKGDKKHHQLATEEILYIEAYGNYCKVHTSREVIISHEKISEFELRLDENLFMRVHKSFLVSRDKIDLIEGNRIIIDEDKIPIGQTYRSAVNRLLG